MTSRTKAEESAVTLARPALFNSWRWWLPVALLALALALIFKDPFAGDWDALDYAVLALSARPSSMLFGRMLFIFFNHLLWLIAHHVFSLPPEQAYLLFKYAVVAQSPLAVIVCWKLAFELTKDVRAAFVAALLLAVSPFYVIYSGQAMTEIPSLLLLAVALTIHLKGIKQQRTWLVLLGAALLGADVNVREAVGLYAPWLIIAPFVCGWRVRRNEILITLLACFLFLICALGPVAFYYFANINNYQQDWHGWLASMRMETAAHPISIANFGPLLSYFFVAAPLAFVAFPVAAWREWRTHRLSPLLAFALVGFAANIFMVVQYSVVINGRYLLTGLPAILPLVAVYFVRVERARNERTALTIITGSVFLITLVLDLLVYPMAEPTIRKHGYTKEYRARLAMLPKDNAVVIAGSGTVSVTFWRGVGVGNWEVIGTGGGWPGDKLNAVIEAHLRAGRRVFLDVDPRLWMARGWQRSETMAIANLGARFRFRHFYETIYELKPIDDETAHPTFDDAPDFSQLLRDH